MTEKKRGLLRAYPNMKIYHYTTIDALALILKSRKFRFSRLDRVDDLEEARVNQGQKDFSKFLFVSCWTENAEESIPLWKLYSGPQSGVRIGVEKEMFSGDYFIRVDKKNGNLIEIRNTLVPDDKIKDFFVLPLFDCNNAPFYRKVEYVDNLNEAASDLVKEESRVKEEKEDGSKLLDVEMNINMRKLGAIKHRRWAFQEECRFSLFMVPGNPYVRNIEYATSLIINSIRQNIAVPFNYYDLPLSPIFFESLEITLAPNALDSQRIIIESLCAVYAPHAIIKDSSLRGKIALK